MKRSALSILLFPVLCIACVQKEAVIHPPKGEQQIIKEDPLPMRMCAQDALQCPNGSWVGRSGPDCAFACPAPSGATRPKN